MIYPDCETCQGKGTVLGSWMDANGRMQSEEVTCYRCQTRTYKDKPELRVGAATRQVGGAHYVNKVVQPWAAMEAWLSPEEFCGYLRGCAIKYLARYRDKGGVQDIEKAGHYIEKLLEIERARLV